MAKEHDCLTRIERRVTKLLAEKKSPEEIHAYLANVLNAAALEVCDDSDPNWWDRYNALFDSVPAPHWQPTTEELPYTR
jgi:hypothetical protein